MTELGYVLADFSSVRIGHRSPPVARTAAFPPRRATTRHPAVTARVARPWAAVRPNECRRNRNPGGIGLVDRQLGFSPRCSRMTRMTASSSLSPAKRIRCTMSHTSSDTGTSQEPSACRVAVERNGRIASAAMAR